MTRFFFCHRNLQKPAPLCEHRYTNSFECDYNLRVAILDHNTQLAIKCCKAQ
jgi:hypothetical protein